MIGEILKDRYQITSLIGEGGMANVYLASDKVNARFVAIKIIKEETAKDALNIARFQRELKAAAALIHPNIVRIYDCGEFDNRPFMVMEYVKGKSLKDVLNTRGMLSPTEAADIMLQLTDALSLAHNNHIIHRDIKPQNILLQHDGKIKLSDFGIATIPTAPSITQQDMVLGSVHYMAPEVAKGSKANALSDVYSAGITFFELLTGKVPYEDSDAVKIAQKHIRVPLPSITQIDKKIPEGYERVVNKACAKHPLERYQSAKLMKNDIQKLMRIDVREGGKSIWTKFLSIFKKKEK